MVTHLPKMWETWVRCLGWEDLLWKEVAIHSSILAWKNPMDRGAWWATVHGAAESDMTEEPCIHVINFCWSLQYLLANNDNYKLKV